MNRFLKTFLFFLLPLMVLSVLADKLLTLGLRHSGKGDFAVWNDVFDGKVDADIVVYGSSRAWRHFDPKIMEDSLGCRVYNLGMDGYNFYMEYQRGKVFLRHNRRPKVIILSLDYTSLDTMRYLYNPEQFLGYLDDSIVGPATRAYEGLAWYDYVLPLIRYAGYRHAIGLSTEALLTPSRNGRDRYKGFACADQEWNDDLAKAEARYGRLTAGVDSNNLGLFRQFIQETKAVGIGLVLVFPPVYKEGQDFVVNGKDVIGLYRRLAGREGVPFLDYTGDSLCAHKTFFYNAEHMNCAGETLFTNDIVRQMRLMGLWHP